MKLLPLYKLIAGGMPEFTRQFQNNEALYKQAQSFWNKLEGVSFFIVIIFVVLGLVLAAYYYQPYNNCPGRHYTPKHWIFFLIGTFALTFLTTLGFEYVAVVPKLQGAFVLELKIALGNAILASFLYFLTSIFWCNALPTNAFRLFKI
ncbi:MAG: hypothetical protein J5529_02775 [Prevotella sp.]|nr:hypothetical protein [Prevotella sp.]